MDTRQFLERVLPASGGQYFVGGVISKRYEQGRPLDTIDEVVDKVERLDRKRANVYYATGVYEGTREISTCQYKKALYVDLDTGGAHKGFNTKRDAVLALKKFCDEANFPFPNIVVDTGGGVHGYWTLSEPVLLADWQPMADALKALCEAHGFAVDESITADAARILRVPGTTNYKDPKAPKPCKILKADPNDFTIDQLQQALATEPAVVTAPSALLADTVGDDDLGANLYTGADRKWNAAAVIEGCAVMKHALDTGGADQPGVLWYRVLHLLAYCEDGADYVHAMSNQHDKYSPAMTDKRFDYAMRRKEQGIGPTTCASFEKFLPSKCATCPHKGLIKTPLVLGRLEEDYLPPGYRMDDVGLWKVVGYNEQGQPNDWQLVFPYRMSDVTLISDGHHVSLRMNLTDGPISRTIVFPLMIFAGELKELQGMFMGNGIYPTDNQSKEFKQVMIPWVRKMVKTKAAVKVSINGLGWSKLNDRIGFATGDAIHMSDGSTEQVSGLDRQMCNDYASKGNAEAWFAAAEAVVQDGDMASLSGVVSAFAAPLIHFTGVSGAMLSLYSKESGTGKSSAMRVGQAVWGHPTRGINALNDTMLSVVKKMGFLHNLPAYWDELRMRDEVQATIKLIFQLGQGKERSRLTSGTKMQEMGTWSTLITVATNEPVLDHIDQVISNTNAGRLRVFEMEMPKRSMTNMNASALLRDLDDNHGHIGAEYAAYLSKNHDKLKDLVQNVQHSIVGDLRATNDERFWVAIVATLYVAACIAAARKWLNVDPRAYKKFLYRQLLSQRAAVTKTYRPTKERAIDLLIQYLDEHRDQLLVCDHLTTRAQKSPGMIHIQPMRGEIVAALAQKDKMLRLKKPPFTTWVYANAKEAPTELTRHLVASGAVEVRGSVSAGLANTLDARVYCLDIDLSSPEFAHLIEGN